MLRQRIALEDVARLAAQLGGGPPGAAIELHPHGTVRSFRAGEVVLRVDEDPRGRALDVEARVLDALATAVTPPIAPALIGAGKIPAGGDEPRPYIAYPWIAGRTLDRASASARARDIGGAFARLHAARVMDLFDRLPGPRPLTLLDAFRRSVEELKAWLSAREADGLGQDLLTLALSDLQRALRPYCIAQDHVFLTARRRVLCHGRASPAFVVVRADAPPVPPPLAFVNLDGACLGDGAEDLATFALAAGLDEGSEDGMLRAYVEMLDQEGRSDRRFFHRYFARRTLGLFAQPMARLERIARIKRGDVQVLGDPVVALEDEARLTYEEIARAMNSLRDLGGRHRPVGVPEVMAMGRLIAIEEMVLADRAFRIAIVGQSYVGKTEIASQLARRLKHRLYGTAALSRALAYIERDMPGARPRELVEKLFERGFVLEPRVDPPFYRAFIDIRDVTDELREGGPLHVRGAQLLDDEAMRGAIRDELLKRSASEGIVVEGAYASSLLSGRAHVFHLSADMGVRRARLFSHRPDVGSEDEAAQLLARLDAAAQPIAADVMRVDVASRTAAAATLEILWHLLPPGRRPQEDLSGRAPL